MIRKKEYTVPVQTRIGHVHLKLSDLQQSLDFYCDLPGFEITTTYGDQPAFISAVGRQRSRGFRSDLSLRPRRQWRGALLELPEGSVAVYHVDGSLNMYTHPLDLENLLNELD